MEYNKEENTIQETEHSVEERGVRASYSRQSTMLIVQCSQQNAKLRNEALLSHYYINLNPEH